MITMFMYQWSLFDALGYFKVAFEMFLLIQKEWAKEKKK